MKKCDNKECHFYKNGTCFKTGKCLKNIDNEKNIQKSVEKYWQRLRDKYNYRK